jgi:pimeloyl-ACP methyl ester carboxylesterase
VPAPTLDEQIAPYSKPQHLVHIENGRTIHFVCSGHGSPTVVLNAGLEQWSFWWWVTQRAVAEQTRVCAWDRAGYGFSSPSSGPQDVIHTTRDLEQALNNADIRGPYVMVGASLGAYEAILFTDRHPQSVVGMVLVDPDIPDRAALEERVAPKYAAMRRAFGEQVMKQLQDCAAQLKSGTLKSTAPEFQRCTTTRHLPDFLGRVKSAIARLDADPARLLTQASLNREQYADHDSREIINPQRHYGDMPLIVLTAGRDESAALPPGAPGTDTPEKLAELREQVARFLRDGWAPAHEAYAALSTRGRHEVVADAGHNIQVDKPDVVIAAILQVVNRK